MAPDTIPPHIWAKRRQIDANLAYALREIDIQHRTATSAHVKDALGPIQAAARAQYLAVLREARQQAKAEARALFGGERTTARQQAKDAHIRAIDALWEEYRASCDTPGDVPGEGEGGRTSHATG